MIIDLNIQGLDALVLGSGEEAEFKVRKLLGSGAKVTVIGEHFTVGLKELAMSNPVKLIEAKPSEYRRLLRSSRPSVVFIASGNPALDSKVAPIARKTGALVNVRDNVAISDFNMLAIAEIGDVRIAISTGGASPAIASLLRKKIEQLVGPDYILKVRLQKELRDQLKDAISDSNVRKNVIYEIIENKKITSLLRQNRFDEAKQLAKKIIESRTRTQSKA